MQHIFRQSVVVAEQSRPADTSDRMGTVNSSEDREETVEVANFDFRENRKEKSFLHRLERGKRRKSINKEKHESRSCSYSWKMQSVKMRLI